MDRHFQNRNHSKTHIKDSEIVLKRSEFDEKEFFFNKQDNPLSVRSSVKDEEIIIDTNPPSVEKDPFHGFSFDPAFSIYFPIPDLKMNYTSCSVNDLIRCVKKEEMKKKLLIHVM
jgi:hypothetical protein